MIRGELFSQDMVKAFLENRKSRTSRPIKPQPTRPYWCGIGHGWDDGHGYEIKPKHSVGDVIYVRETWQYGPGENGPYVYKASPELSHYNPNIPNDYTWHPSIHMPRSAARLWFKVTDVKVQRLDDVTEQDAVEDGFETTAGKDGISIEFTALMNFKRFWKAQYGPDTKWMWVYYLQPVTKEEALKDE